MKQDGQRQQLLVHFCDILSSLKKNEDDQAAITRLIGLGVEIALSSRNLSERIRRTAATQGTDSRSLVISLLGVAFADGGSTITFVKGMLNKPLCCHQAQFAAFYSHIILAVDNALYREFATLDPAGYALTETIKKLLRGLREDGKIVMWPKGNPEWISIPGCDPKLKSQGWSKIEMMRVLSPVFCKQSSVTERVIRGVDELMRIENRGELIPYAEFLQAFRELNRSASSMDTDVTSSLLPDDIAARRLAAAKTMKFLTDVLDGYEKEGRMSSHEVLSYSCALVELVDDLSVHSEISDYWRYLGKYISGLDLAKYRDNYRSFDELAKSAKMQFHLHLNGKPD